MAQTSNDSVVPQTEPLIANRNWHRLDCISSAQLFTVYLTFCDEQGWTPLSQRAFEMKAKDLMVQIHHACPTNRINRRNNAGGQRGYQGVTLKASLPDEAEPITITDHQLNECNG